MRLITATALLAIAVASCASSRPTPKPAAGVYLGAIGRPGCAPSAVFSGGIPETGFDSPKGSLWALFFDSIPPPAGQEIKVVWRMTGSGGFQIGARDAGGKESKLLWGPVDHGGSTWTHPGAEVGTGFKFPHAGCWDIHIARSNVRADLWLAVV